MSLKKLALMTPVAAFVISASSGYSNIAQAQTTRAPGLPAYARTPSPRKAALPDVERVARSQNLGEIFVATVKHLSITESGSRYALPAFKFDSRPPQQRPTGKPLITAWGVFQFNRDAWSSLIPPQARRSRQSWIPRGTAGCGKAAGCVFPWDSTPSEEIILPIQKYAQIFSEVRSSGGNEIDAARGIRLYHIGSGIYKNWLRFARQRNFNVAWRNVNTFDRRGRNLRGRIDKHLRNAGVIL
ncbi:MAG: hypothetical protein AAF378_05540 [Cyanobacteria bacterium P01_A01_bin.84]